MTKEEAQKWLISMWGRNRRSGFNASSLHKYFDGIDKNSEYIVIKREDYYLNLSESFSLGSICTRYLGSMEPIPPSLTKDAQAIEEVLRGVADD